MYEAVWSAKVRVFLLDHHVEKSAEDVRNGDGNQTQNGGTHIRHDASRSVGIRNILEEEMARRGERNDDRGKEE